MPDFDAERAKALERVYQAGKLPPEQKVAYERVRSHLQEQLANENQPSWLGETAKAAGRGLASFGGELLDTLTFKEAREAARNLPAMVSPDWRTNKTQPADPSTNERLQKGLGLEQSPNATLGQRIVGSGVEAVANPVSMMGPGGIPGKIATGFLGGAGSEVAGEFGKKISPGLEVPARVAGATIAGKIPSGAAKTAVPLPMKPNRIAADAILRKEGITSHTAGQTTGNKTLQYGESYLGDAPLSGGKAAKAQEETARQFTRANWKRAGINADNVEPATVDGAFRLLGARFDTFVGRHDAKFDTQGLQDLYAANDKYHSEVQSGMRRAVVDDVLNDFIKRVGNSPTITGKQYSSFRSDLTEKLAAAGGDWQYRNALKGYVEALDGMMERSIPNIADWRDWQRTRRQYRNLIVIADAAVGGEAAEKGFLTPAKMKQVLTSTEQDRRDYARGRGDFADLVHAGNLILTGLPNSGTAQRGMVAATAGGLAAAGGQLALGNIPGAAATAATTLAPSQTGRAIMSKPVQSILRNQKGAGLPDKLPSPAWRTGIVAEENAPGAQDYLANPGQQGLQ